MAIFRFFKMAAAAILDLASLLKTLKGDKMSPGRFSLYYVLNINNQHFKKLYTLKPGSTIVLPDY